MTDIPNEAAVVGARALSNQRGDACESQALREHFASLVLTAAAPHLRAEFIAEVRRAQFEVEARHHFGFGEGGIKCLCGFESVRNRSRTEHITGAVLALLEGGGE